MTVAELIELLKTKRQDAVVVEYTNDEWIVFESEFLVEGNIRIVDDYIIYFTDNDSEGNGLGL